MTRVLSAFEEVWPIAGTFRIARGARTEAKVVTVTITEAGVAGRGECMPYARYGESVDSVLAQVASVTEALQAGLTRQELQTSLPAGAARNAVDCALWDLEAKRTGTSAAETAGVAPLKSLTTAFTLSLDAPENMHDAACAAAARPLLKIKLGGEGDPERIAAVRRGAPNSRLIIDANEGWTDATLQDNLDACANAGVAMIEQPLPAGSDEALLTARRFVPVCADESAHDRAWLDALVGRYDMINIKLDKTGGLTEALALADAADAAGLKIMVGCMVATSLAMAPAFLVAQRAEVVDLDGPLLLAKDRDPGFFFDGTTMMPPAAGLWGE